MTDAGGDGKQVTGLEFDGAVFEVDDKDAFKDEKGLVRIGVRVPIEWLRHHADVDVVVVDGCEDTIQVAALRFARDGMAIDGLDHFVIRLCFVFSKSRWRVHFSKSERNGPYEGGMGSRLNIFETIRAKAYNRHTVGIGSLSSLKSWDRISTF